MEEETSASICRYRPEIRFSDIDAAGIVNNAVMMTYLEQARIELFGEIAGEDWDWGKAGAVVARHEVDYIAPIPFQAQVEIVTWVEAVGRSSMTVGYEVALRKSKVWTIVAKARTVLVSYDLIAKRSIPLHAIWRKNLDQLNLGRPENIWPSQV
jgi:acyl-CoA thioester hydrolase